MPVGILALQGCIKPHLEMLESMSVRAIGVRSMEELAQVDRLILPGGESTTILKLLKSNTLFDGIKDFAKTHPVWGICAGSILLAKEVQSPKQESLGILDVRAIRNFYGTQLDSFDATIEISALDCSMSVKFIRAPLLEPLSQEVKVLATYNNHSVLLRQGRHLVSSFHVELGNDPALHQYFLKL